jgi:hypothetical protein
VADPVQRPYQVGTSLFMLMNLVPMESPPGFVQLNVGKRWTPKDALTLEAITWRYSAPLGIPYGPDYGDPAHAYPGHVRGMGVGLAYQRFLWEGLYVGAHVTPLVQLYFDPQGRRRQTGFQLFCVGRVGYHVAFAKQRLFVEPSVAATSWPINTGLPRGFRAVESRFPSYFLLEPGLHAGVKF